MQEKNKTIITDEIATAEKDIDVFAGWIKRLENPDPTLRTEAGGKGLKLYDEVDRDPHAGAVLQSRSFSVISKDWEILPGEDTAPAEKITEFVKDALKNTNFNQMRQELLQAILYGFYVSEVIWEIKNGNILPRRIRAKHPRRFSFTTDRQLRLLTPQNMIEGEPVPDRKFIRFTYGSSDNPYGKGLGQKLWWPVWFKKHGIKFWMVFLEKFGMPTAVGKYPSGTEPDQQSALLDAIDAIQNEAGVKIPDTMAIDLLEATRSGNVTYESLCEYMDKQISKAVLGQTATTEGTPGKLGNEDAQNETRQDVMEADAGLLDECMNNSLIKWITDYNFPGVSNYPRLHTRTEEEKDLKPLADRDKIIITDMGMGKRIPETYISETYNIPLANDNEAVIGQVAGKQALMGIEKEFSSGTAHDLADVLADRLDVESAGMVDDFTEKIKALVSKSETLEEVRDGLLDLYPKMNASELGSLMQKAFTAAELSGRYEVINDD